MSNDDKPAWGTTSRRTFTIGLGSALAASCLPGPDPEPDASMRDAFAPDGGPDVATDTPTDVPSDVPVVPIPGAASEPPLAVLSRPATGQGGDGNQHVETVERDDDFTTYWVGSRESVLELEVVGGEATLKLRGAHWTDASATSDEFYAGALHDEIHARMGASVVSNVFERLRELG